MLGAVSQNPLMGIGNVANRSQYQDLLDQLSLSQQVALAESYRNIPVYSGIDCAVGKRPEPDNPVLLLL